LRWSRFVVLAALIALAFVAATPRDALARTRLDARVDALTSQQLLTRDPAGLVDPARQRRARAIADLRHGASAAWGIAQIFAFWWLWRSGTGARLRDAMRRRTRSRTAQRAVFGAALGALGPLAASPFAVLAYRVGFNAGVTSERLDGWFFDYLVRIALDAALGAVVVTAVLWLVDHVRAWYLVVIAGLYGGALLAAAFVPLLPLGPPHKTTPTTVATAGADVARRLGVDGTPVVILASSRHSNAMSARAAGIGPTARAVLADVTLEHETPAELRMAIGHADAHVAADDPMRQTLVAVTIFVFAAAIAVLLSDRVGFRRDDDALSRLALVATFLGLVLVVGYPLYTAYVRVGERASDLRLIAALGDRAEIVRAMIRYADDDLVPLCDRRSVRWYFDEMPPLGARIAAVTGRGDPCPGGEQPATASPSP
jgi:Zn-dependent protease with chaperone function